jgi:hypothetical protein
MRKRSFRWIMVAPLFLAVGRRAVAEERVVPFAPSESAPSTESLRWYGWQTLALDTAAVGALALDIGHSPQGITNAGAIPIAIFCLGAPGLHLYHHRWGGAAFSLAMRVAVPTLAAFAFGIRDNDWSNRDAAWGIVGGMVVVSLLDAALAWQPEAVPPKDQRAPAGATPVVLVVAPSAETIALRLGGRF